MRRFFETVPAILAWLTLILMFALSRFLPVWISIFIILFDIYWLLKTVFLSFHLRATFMEMKKNMKVDWLAELEKLKVESKKSNVGEVEEKKTFNFQFSTFHLVQDWRDIQHLIILPMYNEPYEVVRESFMRLAAAHYPKDRMAVVLALEERAGVSARETGDRIKEEFKDTFREFLVTIHPKDLRARSPARDPTNRGRVRRRNARSWILREFRTTISWSPCLMWTRKFSRNISAASRMCF